VKLGNLLWTDIDSEKATVTISPEKNSRPRRLGISRQLVAMLNSLPKLHEFIFRNPHVNRLRSLEDFSRNFIEHRRTVAGRLQNPRITRIGFKTLRHFKPTTEYHRTKDILQVMQLLAHKSIKNTLVYTHLVKGSARPG